MHHMLLRAMNVRQDRHGSGRLASKHYRAIRISFAMLGLGRSPRYLEIGVNRAETFTRVATRGLKVGVDPVQNFSPEVLKENEEFFLMSSDDFFDGGHSGEFDLIYIDGLHERQQVSRDIANAFSVLAPGGLIIVDDTVPVDQFSADPSQENCLSRRKQAGLDGGIWTGDVYKAIYDLRMAAHGIGVATIAKTFSGKPVHGQTILWRKFGFAAKQGLLGGSGPDAPEFEEAFRNGVPDFLAPTTAFFAVLKARVSSIGDLLRQQTRV